MTTMPSTWVVQRIAYGEGKKHFYALEEWAPSFFPNRGAAADRIKREIRDEPKAMYALMKIEAIATPEVEIKFTDAA
jgi:hypothetical protein